MKLSEKTLESNIVCRGKIITMRQDKVELENGRIATRDVVEHPGGVCVLPLTDREEIIMVRQFRYPYKEVLTELPAGKLDKNGESPLECGKRELEEETGLTATEWVSLGILYPSPGYCDEIIHLFLARGLRSSSQRLDEDEFLEVEHRPFAAVLDDIMAGDIKDAKTQIAVLKAARLLQK